MVVVLGAALLAGCFDPTRQQCHGADFNADDNWICPAGYDCVAPPRYCGIHEDVAACDGKAELAACQLVTQGRGVCVGGSCTACSPNIAGCQYVGWQPMDTPNTSNGTSFKAAWVIGPTDVFAVGGLDLVSPKVPALFEYDGGSWNPLVFPAMDAVVSGVWGSDHDHVLVTTSNGRIYQRAGSDWVEATLPSPVASLFGVWGNAGNSVFAAGSMGTILHFDGTTWTSMPSPVAGTGATLHGVSGSSSDNIFAFGVQGLILRYDGASWSTSRPANIANATLNALWASGPSEAFAVGDAATTADKTPTILHFDGTTWSAMSLPMSISNLSTAANPLNLNGVWGSSAQDVFFAGASGVILHWDGALWTQMATSSQVGVRALAGGGPRDIYAVGDGEIIWHYTGASWIKIPGPVPSTNKLNDAWAAAANDVVVVGDAGTVLRLTDAGWQTQDTTKIATTTNLNGVWGSRATDVYVVGGEPAAEKVFHASGAAWDLPPIDVMTKNQGPFTDVGAAGANVFATSSGLWDVTTGQWSLDPAPDPPTPRPPKENGLWGSPSGDIYLAGDGIHRWSNAGGLSELVQPKGDAFTAIWGSSDNDLFAVGPRGTITHYDGAWSTIDPAPTDQTLDDIWGTGPDDVFAVGHGATILHYQHGTWTKFEALDLPPNTTADFLGVSGDGQTVYFCGTSGTLLRLIRTAGLPGP